MKRALLASYTKDDSLIRLARLLVENDWAILASAGTAKFLSDHGIPSRDIAEMVGPPILGHRVVTLSRRIYASLLASTQDDLSEIDRMGIRPIGLVYVTLYPLEETIADPRSSQRDVIEKTDIGGPTLLRAAAKGRRFVLSSPSQIPLIEHWFKNGCSEKDRDALVTKLAAAAERQVADYVDASARYWEKQIK